ncbi:MAG: histidine--tRNA ligase [Patescibacteria group bacterium]
MSSRKEKKVKTKKAAPKKAEVKLVQSPKGMHDHLPEEQPWRDRVRETGRELAQFYGFGRLETPTLEHVDLFLRGVGEETDLVGKEMYTLKTKGGDVLALRPEGPAPALRAYLEHGLSSKGQPQKLFYEASIFRHENPQAGRYREHTQTGFEIIGGLGDPLYDGEVIAIASHFLDDLKIKGWTLKINSMGCRTCRPTYRAQLQAYYKRHEKEICKDCERRLETNPLRLLDCKNEKCQPLKAQAPNILDKLCIICSRHFRGVFEYLEELSIPYMLDHTLVRGFDYYSRTVFEFYVEGSDVGAVLSGGRYDYLSEMIGGRATPAVGFATGWERLTFAMKTQGVKLPERPAKKIFVVHVGELAKKKAFKLIDSLRNTNLQIIESLGKESLKAQLKIADREKAVFALILGQKEIYEESVIVRDLRTGSQETVRMDKIEEEIRRRWKVYTE